MARKKPNKFDAVRQALSELGNDAQPLQLQTHLKDRGIEMTTKHISTYKGAILRGKPAAKKPAAAKPATNGSHAAANGAVAKTARAIGLSEQVAMLKAVAGMIGKDEAKKIIDLL